MTNTTIAVSTETKEIIKNLAIKGETYDDIIQKMSAVYEEFLNRQYKKFDEKHKFKKLVF